MLQNPNQLMTEYNSPQLQWERYSAIRTRPRRLVSDQENEGYFFPEVKQPILIHPRMKNISEEQKDYILIQSLFKYMNDIANIEQDVINRAAYGITKDIYSYIFSPEIKRDALTIIIDETYHAYVALDFMYQISEYRGIKILPLPKETELSVSIIKLSEGLSDIQKLNFELISVAIAEHALTTDLIDVAKSKGVSKIFYNVMHDHVLDEKRHANYFEKVLQIFWAALEEEDKRVIAPLLTKLINLYTSPVIQKEFDRSILVSVQIPQEDINVILDETHFGWRDDKLDEQNLIVKQMLALLKKAGVTEHELVKTSFNKFGISL